MDEERVLYNAKTLDPSFKGVVFNYLMPELDEMKQQKEITICREAMYSNNFAIYFAKNFFLLGEVNELIGNCKSAGIFDFIISKYVDENLMNRRERHPPIALKYGHIEGFFTIFCAGCALAVFSFICEITFPDIL